ncbi:cystathionine beta-lyase [Tropicimonas isoalkanivorans]|uniref:Cystathionine beta-lyase n=1 Tax=Tropicimonas isoalkanivorans TaxID=441112 RepID=A0A1I1KW78_9RHOB|nr:cystathionine beta-lyase [Tropicimonas isoalkanivorans]SFC62393.1 cystathionine beta-lyase [Tropicimonas isoalkanivorans]
MKTATKLVSVGRSHAHAAAPVNPPVIRASTFLFNKLEEFETAQRTPFDGAFYGRVGTPTTFAFEQAICALEGGHRSIATASGLAAITATLMAFAEAGAHMLVVDTVYDPVRRLCNRTLARMGVSVTYYDPAVGAGIADLIRDETTLIYMESPGTGTFEIQDIPSIVAAAKSRGVPTAIDATWATPLFLRPIEMGVDVSIHAATKYIVGHSDGMLGVLTTTAKMYDRLRAATQDLGGCAGVEECNLALRGLRTLQARLSQQGDTAFALAQWLESRDEVARVLYPALSGFPGHDLWKRHFDGASGVFTIELTDRDPEAARRFIDALALFSIGFSWGGYESLVLPVNTKSRTLPNWQNLGPMVRLQIGMEDPEDLRADLEQALAAI